MRIKILIAIVLLIGASVGVYLYGKYRIAPKVEFSALDVTDLNGNPIAIDAFKGKKVLVNFFGTWCGACIHEFPLLGETQDMLANDGYVFVCVSDEPVAKLKAFRQRINARIVVLHSNRTLKEMGINTIPTNYVLSPNGEIVFKQVGEITSSPTQFAAQLRGLFH